VRIGASNSATRDVRLQAATMEGPCAEPEGAPARRCAYAPVKHCAATTTASREDSGHGRYYGRRAWQSVVDNGHFRGKTVRSGPSVYRSLMPWPDAVTTCRHGRPISKVRMLCRRHPSDRWI
jgi:hypothetical protein